MQSRKGIPIIQSERTKETSLEFGRAGRGCALMLTAFYQSLKDVKEQGQVGRLNSRLLTVIQSDPVNDLGERTIAQGDLSLLEGFDFYKNHHLLRLLPSSPTVLVNRKKGQCSVCIAPFLPAEWISGETTATHLAFTVAAAEMDFKRERFASSNTSSEPLPVDAVATCTLVTEIPKDSSLPIVVSVGVRFLKLVNGKAYPMSGKCFQIVKTDILPTPAVKKKTPTALQKGKKQKAKD